MENKTYPSRKTYTFSFFQLSIFRFDESTYPTENAHVQHFPDHREWKMKSILEKNLPLLFRLSIFQFAESTYPTENAQIEDFPNHRERKTSPIP